MKILFAMVILAAWVLGIYDGDCTAAVMFSLFGALAAVDKLREYIRKRRSTKKYYETGAIM